MQIGIANGIPLNDVITGDDLVPAYDQSTGTEGYVNLTTAVQKAFSGSAAGTANGVLYLNGSKQATSGSALTFDGSVLGVEAELDVKSAANLLFLNSDNTNYMYLNNPAGSGAGIGQLAFTLGGVGEQMRLTSTGLGIGTSSPVAKLDVNGNANLAAGGQLIWGGAYNYYIQSDNSTYLRFATGASERMRLDSAGNLGLGVTPSAWSSLHKAFQIGTNGALYQDTNFGTTFLSTNSYVNAAGNDIYLYTGSASRYVQTNNGSHYWFTAPSGTAGDAISFTQAMTLDANGNLGVGTSSTDYSGRVVGVASTTSSSGLVSVSSSTASSDYARITLYQPGNDTFSLEGGSVGLRFLQSGISERARIDSSGNLLVGASAAVDQSKVLIAYSGGSNQGLIFADSDSTSGNNAIRFKVTGSTVGSVTTSATATAYNTSSDYRLKNITGPVTNSGAYIDSLNPVEGTWKADGSTFVGLIAHEVQEVSRTQVATGEKDGEQMQAMDYSNSELIANLIAEVKSLRARVAALESN